MFSVLHFSQLAPFTFAFMKGAEITLMLSVTSFVIGSLLGLIAGILLIELRPISAILLIMNDAIRAIPPLVLIFAVYYLPYATLLNIPPPGSTLCAIIALSISQAAYTADLVYFAYRNVSPRLIEAGQALGIPKIGLWQALILPDIARQILPAEIAFFIGIVRLSSLASVIGVAEVVFVAQVSISKTFMSIEPWTIVGLIYIALILPLTYLARVLERTTWIRRRF